MRRLDRVERYTWRRHWRAQVASGLGEGVLGLASFVALRSLGAPTWIAPLIVVLAQSPWMFSPMWEHAVARFEPHRAFRWFGAAFALPLVAIAFVSVTPGARGDGHGVGDVGLFLACYVVAQAVHGGDIAQRSALIRANYRERVRGSVFGALAVIARGASIASAKAAGVVLEADPRWLRVVFPVAGALSFGEQMLLSRIRWRRDGLRRAAQTAGGGFREAWKRSVRLLRDDRDFRTYEIAWSLYGMGFLASTPMIVVFGERDLGASYATWTWAQGVSMPLAQIAATAPFGWLVDRVGAVRTTAFAYVLVTLFLASVPFVHTGPALVACFALWGVAMAGVNIVWNVGPLAFAPEGRGRHYAAAHVALVGLRSLLGPPLGYLLFQTVGMRATFALCAALVACGTVTAFRLSRRR